jgi:hypothetical protein
VIERRGVRSRHICQKSDSLITCFDILITLDVCPGFQESLFSIATRLLAGYPAFPLHSGTDLYLQPARLIVSVKVDVLNGIRYCSGTGIHLAAVFLETT